MKTSEIFNTNFEVIYGDLLQASEGIILHGCNTQGFFNAGVAKAIRQMYPEAYQDYMKHFRTTGLRLGQVIVTKVQSRENLYIFSGMTQEQIGRQPGVCYVNYDAIAEVFKKTFSKASSMGHTVHFPAIGSGLGGGDWDTIFDIIFDTLISSSPAAKGKLYLM